MFEKIFSKGAYFALIIATIPVGLIFGQVGMQMKDLLCGCDYCKTVDPGVPLHIGYHMMKCHSWREGMQETMEMMRQSKQPKIEVEPRTEEPAIEENFLGENPQDENNPYKDYTWKETELHGWAYATTKQIDFNIDQWIYLEELGWVWSMAKPRNFAYSYDFGWIYFMLYQNNRVLYWYDRRIWMLPQNFTPKK